MVVVNLKEKDRQCFSFCQDLSNKELKLPNYPKKGQNEEQIINDPTLLDNQINIKWALFRLRQLPNIFGGPGGIKDSEIIIPGAYHVEKIKPDDWTSLLTKSEKYDVFVAPSDYYEDKCLFKTWPRRHLTIDLPDEFKEQPHLYKHSTFQFCFLKNVIFPTNCQFLDIDENNKIKATIDITASPAGTYFIFQSGQIPFKWKLDVRQGIMTWNLIRDTIDAVQNTAKSIGSGLIKAFSLGTIDVGKAKKPMEELTKDLMTGKDGFKSMGIDREKINRIQELQTQRMFQSTAGTGESMLEPSVFYSNSIQFPYSLYDLSLRSALPRYEVRIYISKTLFNNLVHNNNENPITYPLNITFEKLAQILKPGFIKGRLDLDYDPNNRMAECFARGITFYDDKKKFFVNPKLDLVSVRDDRAYLIPGIDSYTAQAITEGGEGLTIDIPYQADQRGYSHSTFIKIVEPQDNECINISPAMDDFKNVLVRACGANEQALHYNSQQGFCWGCTYDELKRVGFLQMKWTATMDCRMVFSLYVSGLSNINIAANTEYSVTISETQFIFKTESTTKITWQKQPTQDDFSALDWSPPPGSGGDIEIPLEDPEIAIPEPSEGDPSPEPDFPVDPFDPTGGEPEIPPIEPDLPPDIDPGLDPDAGQNHDPPPIDPDPPLDPDPPVDPDLPVDPTDPDPPNDPDPNDDDGD